MLFKKTDCLQELVMQQASNKECNLLFAKISLKDIIIIQ